MYGNMEKIAIPLFFCEYGLHLASLFLLIFCLPNYKIVFDFLVLMYSKIKNDFIRFFFLIFEYPVFSALNIQIDARQGRRPVPHYANS